MNSLVMLASADLVFISRYFKSHFKLIRKVRKANVSIFRDKKWKYLFHYFSSSFVSLFSVLLWIILSSLQNFIYCRKFYLAQWVWRILSTVETLSSAETFIQHWDLYLVWRFFFLTKQWNVAHTATAVCDFKNYNCNYMIVKEY